MKFAMLMTAENGNMVTVSSIATILFLGGWLPPLPGEFVSFVPTVTFLGLSGALLYIAFVEDERLVEKIVLPVLAAVSAAVGLAFLIPEFRGPAEGVFWFVAKVLFFLFLYIWVRWTLPRFRYDQLMDIGWKFLFPLALANIVLTSLAVVLRK